MKKQLFAFALLAAAISFASCGKKEGGKVESISITPRSAVLSDVEPSIRLGLKYTPTDAAKPTAVWSSSDTTVATVTNTGFVEAASYGSCYIYAQVDNLKDSCLIEVKTYMESLIFNGAIVWKEDTTYAMDPATGKMKIDTIESTSGDIYYAYKAMAELWVMSDGFYINNSGHLDGTETGTLVQIFAPMFYAPGYLNNSDRNTVFCLGKWGVTEDYKGMKIGEPGKISDEAAYVALMKQFLEAYNTDPSTSGEFLKAAGELVTGSQLLILEYNAEAEGYYNSYIADAMVMDTAEVYLNNNYLASQYMCGLDYAYIEFTPLAGDWGMNITQDQAGKLVLADEDIHYGDPILSTYGLENNAQKGLVPVAVPELSKEVKANIERELKEKNVVVLKKKF